MFDLFLYTNALEYSHSDMNVVAGYPQLIALKEVRARRTSTYPDN